MNSIRNKVILIGHIGQEPEAFEFEGGGKKVSFTLATNDSYRNKGGDKVDKTEWHKLVAFGKTAETIEKYVRKGQQLAIEGKLTSRSYESKTGEKRYITEVVISDFVFLSKKEPAVA